MTTPTLEGATPDLAAPDPAAQHPLLAARLAETSATLKELGEKLDEALAAVDREAAEPMIVAGLAEVRQALGVPEGKREALDEYLAQVHAFLLEFVPIAFAAGDRAAATASPRGCAAGNPRSSPSSRPRSRSRASASWTWRWGRTGCTTWPRWSGASRWASPSCRSM